MLVVRYYQDSLYSVCDSENENYLDYKFRGNLSDCEAYIRLKEGGRLFDGK